MKNGFHLLLLLYAAFLFLWFDRVYQFYFQSSWADRVSLFLVIAVSFVLSQRFLQVNRSVLIMGFAGLLVIVPLLLQPLTINLLSFTDHTWIIMHLLIGLCGIALALQQTVPYLVLPALSLAITFFLPYEFDRNQGKYFDRVVASMDTRKGSTQIVKWQDNYWVHYNGELQFSTIDAAILKEAFVQPVMHLDTASKDVLVLGGDNGLIINELGKFDRIGELVVFPMDKEFYYQLQENNPVNDEATAMQSRIVEKGTFQYFLADTTTTFDVILIDLPDPKTLECRQFYSQAFYELCFQKLTDNGHLVTQSGDLHLGTRQFHQTLDHISAAGFSTLPYHTQIPSKGQRSWILASKKYSRNDMKGLLEQVNPGTVTRWWNAEAMRMMLSFGKTSYFSDL